MSEWMKAIAYAMITLFLGFLLREFGFRGYRLAVIVGTVGVIGVAVIGIGDMLSSFSVLGQDIDDKYVKMILKIIGVGYVSGICSDVCIDLGELGLSNAVILVGKCEIVAIAAPCVVSIIEQGVSLI